MSIYPDWLGEYLDGGGDGERYPAYLSVVTFSPAVATISRIVSMAVNSVAAIGSIKTVNMTRFPAGIFGCGVAGLVYPAQISNVVYSGIHGVAGISNIRT